MTTQLGAEGRGDVGAWGGRGGLGEGGYLSGDFPTFLPNELKEKEKFGSKLFYSLVRSQTRDTCSGLSAARSQPVKGRGDGGPAPRPSLPATNPLLFHVPFPLFLGFMLNPLPPSPCPQEGCDDNLSQSSFQGAGGGNRSKPKQGLGLGDHRRQVIKPYH